jgi:hypothetical protein
MKKTLSFVVISILCSLVVRPMQGTDFTVEQLSPKGRTAYTRLRSACVFRIGGVGYADETSEEELALYDLLEEQHAVEALKSLVAVGSYEGGLYGLLGLSLRDNTEFNQAVVIYKARNEKPEWQNTGSFKCFHVTGETVNTQSGCIGMTESRVKIVSDIESGKYDKLITGKYWRRA